MRRVFEYERRPPGALGGEKSRRGTDFPGSGRSPRGVFTLIPSRSSLPSVASILLDRRHTRSTVCLAVRCPRGGPRKRESGHPTKVMTMKVLLMLSGSVLLCASVVSGAGPLIVAEHTAV